MQQVEHAVREDDRRPSRRTSVGQRRPASSPIETRIGVQSSRLVEADAGENDHVCSWPVDADVRGPRLHAEGVEQAVVVVRIAVGVWTATSSL